MHHPGHTDRPPVPAAEPRHLKMQLARIVRRLQQEMPPGFIRQRKMPAPFVASDSNLVLAKPRQTHMVGGLDDQGVEQTALGRNTRAVGSQQAPRLTSQKPPLAGPVFAPI